jgi:hypothetical protein
MNAVLRRISARYQSISEALQLTIGSRHSRNTRYSYMAGWNRHIPQGRRKTQYTPLHDRTSSLFESRTVHAPAPEGGQVRQVTDMSLTPGYTHRFALACGASYLKGHGPPQRSLDYFMIGTVSTSDHRLSTGPRPATVLAKTCSGHSLARLTYHLHIIHCGSQECVAQKSCYVDQAAGGGADFQWPTYRPGQRPSSCHLVISSYSPVSPCMIIRSPGGYAGTIASYIHVEWTRVGPWIRSIARHWPVDDAA